MPTPPTERRYGAKTTAERRAERRARLLDAAVEAFGTTGYRGTSIEQLCSAAGISTRNFYEEFRTRELLLIELHDQLNARALEAAVAAIAEIDPDDFPGRAHAGAHAYFRVMTADRRWARIALVESVGVSPEAEAHRREAIDRFAAVLQLETTRLAEAGLLPRRDYRLTAVAVVGAINGLINTWSADVDWGEQVHAVADEAARIIVVATQA